MRVELRILHVDMASHVWGGEIIAASVSASLRKRGHTCAFVCLENSQVAAYVRCRGLDRFEMPCRPGEGAPLPLIRIARIARWFKPDIVHIYRGAEYVWASLGVKIGAPRSAVVITRTIPFSTGRLLTRYLRFLRARVIAVSTFVKCHLLVRGFLEDGVDVIPCGIDLSLFELAEPRLFSGNERPSTLAIIGRISPEKGHKHLVMAVRQLVDAGRQISLQIVGTGELEERLRALVRRRHLEDIVRFNGYRSDVRPFLREVDVLVMPSLYDGFGLAALEAMACGIPVVVTDRCGIIEHIVSGQTGMIAQTGNVGDIAAKIAQLLDDPQLARRVGLAGRELVAKRFTDDKVAAQIERVYMKALRGKPRSQVSKRTQRDNAEGGD